MASFILVTVKDGNPMIVQYEEKDAFFNELIRAYDTGCKVAAAYGDLIPINADATRVNLFGIPTKLRDQADTFCTEFVQKGSKATEAEAGE